MSSHGGAFERHSSKIPLLRRKDNPTLALLPCGVRWLAVCPVRGMPELPQDSPEHTQNPLRVPLAQRQPAQQQIEIVPVRLAHRRGRVVRRLQGLFHHPGQQIQLARRRRRCGIVRPGTRRAAPLPPRPSPSGWARSPPRTNTPQPPAPGSSTAAGHRSESGPRDGTAPGRPASAHASLSQTPAPRVRRAPSPRPGAAPAPAAEPPAARLCAASAPPSPPPACNRPRLLPATPFPLRSPATPALPPPTSPRASALRTAPQPPAAGSRSSPSPAPPLLY